MEPRRTSPIEGGGKSVKEILRYLQNASPSRIKHFWPLGRRPGDALGGTSEAWGRPGRD